MEILAGYGDAFEQLSVDEAYVEFRNTSDYQHASLTAEDMKRRIFDAEGLTCSIGIGPNPLIAKIASDYKKPDGLTIVRPHEVDAFLAPLGVRALPGIGPKTEAALAALGIATIADLRRLTKRELTRRFGAWGSKIYEKARGNDDAPVGEPHEAQSIGEQETFGRDTLDCAFLLERVATLSRSVWAAVREAGCLPSRVALIVRFADFVTVSRRRTKKTPIASAREFEEETLRLFLPFLDRRENPEKKKIRLIGVRGEKLVAMPQGLGAGAR
jgi:DNA polymerase IV (DinB-like DNA polymerase)